MNILQVLTRFPYPPDSGGKIAVFNPIRELARLGHHVHVVIIHDGSPADTAALGEWCEVDLVNINKSNSVQKAVESLASPMPLTIYKYISPKVFRAIDKVVTQKKFDVAHLEFIHTAEYGARLKKHHGLPIALREQNVEAQLHKRYAAVTKPPLKWYLELQASRMFEYEKKMSRIFDLCMMITENDSRTLLEMQPEARTSVLPAGVDPEAHQPVDVEKVPGKLVFLGTMDWPPNVDAVQWFAKDIFPGIKKGNPDAVFYIVGSGPAPSVQALHNGKDIIVTGYVEDIREHVCGASLFVVPLRVGGGMRLKILEAMALCTPVITTSVGCEGIDAEHGRHIFIADRPEDFIDTVNFLLNNPDKAKLVTEEAATLIREKYSWGRITKDITVPAYEQAIANAEERINSEE